MFYEVPLRFLTKFTYIRLFLSTGCGYRLYPSLYPLRGLCEKKLYHKQKTSHCKC